MGSEATKSYRHSSATDNVSVRRVENQVRRPQEIKVCVQQGSGPSPLLFIIVMEEATRNFRSTVPWNMLQEDDLRISAESKFQSIDK